MERSATKIGNVPTCSRGEQQVCIVPFGVSCSNRCGFLSLSEDNAEDRQTIVVEREKSFSLEENESFILEALIAEGSGSPSDDCSQPPYYIPTTLVSSCRSSYSKTFNFSELVIGDTISINPAETGIVGDQNCDWSALVNVQVE